MNRYAINPLHVFIILAAVMILSGIVYTGVQKSIKLFTDVQEVKTSRCLYRVC